MAAAAMKKPSRRRLARAAKVSIRQSNHRLRYSQHPSRSSLPLHPLPAVGVSQTHLVEVELELLSLGTVVRAEPLSCRSTTVGISPPQISAASCHIPK